MELWAALVSQDVRQRSEKFRPRAPIPKKRLASQPPEWEQQ